MGMPLSFRSFALPLLSAAAALASAPVFAGCNGSSTPAITLPSFQDVTSAPAAIQRAAEAVVRIETMDGLATGSFISASGLLMTNNHVLGTEICPLEGCYASITFDYQRGKKPSDSQLVFVKPIAVSVGLDMAVVQVYASQGGAVLATPSFLTIESHDTASLMKMHVNLVGHPEGHLKKWTTGEVVDSEGDWVVSSAFILPGNSGSPILSDAGALVGIVHRGPTGEDFFTANGVVTYSVGTPSALLQAAMQAQPPLPPEMISVAAPATHDAIVANDLVYLNARVSSVALASAGAGAADGGVDGGGADTGAGGAPTGAMTTVLAELGTACDAALAVHDYATPEDLDGAIVPCGDALSWIECRAEHLTSPTGTVCPGGSDAAAWLQRFTQVNAATVALNDQASLSFVSFGAAQLTGNDAAGTTAGAAGLQQALKAISAPLDPDVANYLAAFDVSSYGGVQIASYVSGYTSIPDYAISAGEVASSALWLYTDNLLGNDAALGIVEALYADPSVDLGTKLYVEDIEYQAGVIQ